MSREHCRIDLHPVGLSQSQDFLDFDFFTSLWMVASLEYICYQRINDDKI